MASERTGEDITDGTATLTDNAVAIGLITKEQRNAIYTAETPFERASKFIQVFSEVTNDPEAMKKFVDMLQGEGIDLEVLGKFVAILKQEGADEKLIKEVGKFVIVNTQLASFSIPQSAEDAMKKLATEKLSPLPQVWLTVRIYTS